MESFVKTWILLVGFSLLLPDVNCQNDFSVDGLVELCPLENITITCTVSGTGISWRFQPSGQQIIVTPNANSNLPSPIEEPLPGAFVNVIFFNGSVLTGRLILEAMAGLTVTCSDYPAGNVVGAHTIERVAVPASSPLNVVYTVASFLSNGAMVELSWDPPTSNGGRDDLSYIVVPSPAPEEVPPIVTETTGTFIASYGVRYTVGVITQNCAGNSTAQEIVITVCRPDPSLSTGGAVGITVALAAVVFTPIGMLFMWLLMHCKKLQNSPSNGHNEMTEISKAE